jgi:hypothetical protein
MLLICQDDDRFNEDSLLLFRQMSYFTDRGLRAIGKKPVQADDIRHLCSQYGFDEGSG